VVDTVDAAPATQARIAFGLRENWRQFTLLVLVNAFVGGMVGLERTLVPLIGSETFRLASTVAVTSFIISFGVVKAVTNLVSGQLADTWGRKKTLVLGWAVGLPVPFLIMWAPAWEWIIAANVLLGVNQGLAWSMTVLMKIDLVGPRQRGLAVGLNEFAGYLAVGSTAFLTGYLATIYGLRPVPFYLGVAYTAAGLLLSALVVRDTRKHVALERSQHPRLESSLTFGDVFLRASLIERNLFAASQAGLVNNLNDGMSWGIFPLFFVAAGLGVERIGILKGVYPAVWGILQVATGPLSDRWGRKGLIAAGCGFKQRGFSWSPPFTTSAGGCSAASCSGLGRRWSIRACSPRFPTPPIRPGVPVRSASIGSGATSAMRSVRSQPACSPRSSALLGPLRQSARSHSCRGLSWRC
jgi:MFS family permease